MNSRSLELHTSTDVSRSTCPGREVISRVSSVFAKIFSTVFGGLWGLLAGASLTFYFSWKLVTLSLVVYACRRNPVRFLWSIVYLLGISPFMYAVNTGSWDDHPGRALMTALLTLVVAEYTFRALGRRGVRNGTLGLLGAVVLLVLF